MTPRAIWPLLLLSLLLIGADTGYCTTIIIRMDKGRILVAADTRRIGQAADNRQASVHDDQCKVLHFGQIAVTMTGMAGYDRAPSDVAQASNAFDGARNAYTSNGKDLDGLANNWALRVKGYFDELYAIHPDTVTALGQVNSQHMLVRAFFVMWVPNDETSTYDCHG
jgi:hypothetical protein